MQGVEGSAFLHLAFEKVPARSLQCGFQLAFLFGWQDFVLLKPLIRGIAHWLARIVGAVDHHRTELLHRGVAALRVGGFTFKWCAGSFVESWIKTLYEFPNSHRTVLWLRILGLSSSGVGVIPNTIVFGN